MSGPAQLDISSTQLISLAVTLVGFAAFWSNPKRAVNRAFFGASIHVALWLACLDQAMRGGEDGQFWMRTTSVVGAFIVVSMWLIKEAIVTGKVRISSLYSKEGGAFLIPCLVLALLATTRHFVAPPQAGVSPRYLWGYSAYIIILFILFIGLFLSAWREMRSSSGVSKYELQVILLGGLICSITVLVSIATRAVLELPSLVRFQPVIVLGFYCFTVFCITTGKVFSGRQLVMISLRKLVIMCLVFMTASLSYAILKNYLGSQMAVFSAVILSLWILKIVGPRLDKIFHFYPGVKNMREAIFVAATRERDVSGLESSISSILASWAVSEKALIIHGGSKLLCGSGFAFQSDHPLVGSIERMKWATPERLQRERESPDRLVLSKFLVENELGVLIFEQGFGVKLLLGIGRTVSRKPFTYPQVLELLEVAPIVESVIERSHFSEKIRRTEQMAAVGMLGASLAHEIRNPLVSIKAFSQLLPLHYEDVQFRKKFFDLMIREVARIEELTDQLLDMASPRVYQQSTVDISNVIDSCMDMLRAKAEAGRIRLIGAHAPDSCLVYTDQSAAKQVLLNLFINAIQALEPFETQERWVRVETRKVPGRLEVVVSDSGPGVAIEFMPRLFEPFQSSKSSGFGLGLVICRNILMDLGASISVDQPTAGRGAVFRVNFPTP